MTQSARRHAGFVAGAPIPVFSVSELTGLGVSRANRRAAIDADRWQQIGRAVVAHRGPLTKPERWQIALVNCGPRSALTGLTGAEALGLVGWDRPTIEVLVPRGSGGPRLPGIRVHRRDFGPRDLVGQRRIHRMAPALILATDSLDQPRHACGLLAAGVQQRLVSATALVEAAGSAARTRNRRLLLAVLRDIEMGAQALSEIDFVQLCRRHRLPPPRQQAVRTDAAGRRRYLDALWDLPDGRELVAEVDGALHLVAHQWWRDQIRQNDLLLGGRLLLRFPSVVVRTEELIVVRQLARALDIAPPQL